MAMGMNMNPRTKKIIESIGCDASVSCKAAEEIMMGYLSEAEHILEECVLKPGGSPHTPLLHAAYNLPYKLAELKKLIRSNINRGQGGVEVDGTSLARLIAMLAVSATSALKDIAFIMSRKDVCAKCNKREQCKGNYSSEGDVI